MTQKILVTGGTGFIGSHTTVELIKDGYEVVIVDDLSNSKIEVLDGIQEITGVKPQFYQFNICDERKLMDCLKAEQIDAIIHFAASKAVGESVSNPLLYYRNNLVSLMNLLDAMRQFGVGHMVFSSSCTVYGQPDQLPVTEDTPFQKAESPYGHTKQIGEDILRHVATAYPELNSIALRYFNPVGAHESALIGELPIGVPNNLIPYITQTAAGLRDELSIFGDDYDTPDGTAVRDYIHVVDLAKAHAVALDRLLKGANKEDYEFFNLGTGKGYSVLDVIKTFERVNKVKVNYKIVERRDGDIEKIYANTDLANNELGWKAELGLEDMLKSVWKWQKHMKGKSY
ncbi:MAG: UDP-glucose 4-epimerase GalE [Reichenbachiella sp.]|uniref:UDP-glucose 4-epimerase GalE n=1 Tax=Reichenbachiella sp. TaxID=2184521 RepID=UPI003265719B